MLTALANTQFFFIQIELQNIMIMISYREDFRFKSYIYFKAMEDSWKLEQNAKFLVDQS